MSSNDQISQLLSTALQLLQENDPFAAEQQLRRLPASAADNIYTLYLSMQVYRLTERPEAAVEAIDKLAQSRELADDVLLNTLPLCVELEHASAALDKQAAAALGKPGLEAAAARYLLHSGAYQALLKIAPKLTTDDGRYCALLAAAYSGQRVLPLQWADKLSAAFRQQEEVAANLLSLERLRAHYADKQVSKAAPGRLFVITPLGPGHQQLLEQCRASVAALKCPKGWQVEHLVIDDTAGQLGRSQARNQGVAEACEQGADWLFFLDADDLMEPEALLAAEPYLAQHEAVWGLIASFKDGQAPRIRPYQLPYIDDEALLLAAGPYLSLQMGVFVKASIAAATPFDTSMQCGEDFRFYHELWATVSCRKIPARFFCNRRGQHSTGPLAASGAEWRRVTEQLTEARRADLQTQVTLQGRQLELSLLYRQHGLHYLSENFAKHSGGTAYAYQLCLPDTLPALEFIDGATRLLTPEALVAAHDLDHQAPLLVDLRRHPQRLFALPVLQALGRFQQVEVLAATAEDLHYFTCNLPWHRHKGVETDPRAGCVRIRCVEEPKQPPRYICIAGFSRSGSTMAYNMLATTVKNFQFFDEERPLYPLLYREQGPLISKRPLDIFDAQRINRAEQASQTALLLCFRDPRAMLSSRHKGVSHDYFMGYDKTWFIKGKGEAAYTNPGILDTQAAIRQWLVSNSLHSVLPLRYEDLVENTALCQQWYGEILGLEYEGDFADFHRKALGEGLTAPLNEVRAVDSAAVEKWRAPEHSARLASQFARCPALYDVMDFYGYGTGSHDWQQ